MSQWKAGLSSGPFDTFVLPNNRFGIILIPIVTFSYSGYRGKIYLLSGARGKVNGRADEIFLQYQHEAAKGGFFRRYPLQAVSHRYHNFTTTNIFLTLNSIDVCTFFLQREFNDY